MSTNIRVRRPIILDSIPQHTSGVIEAHAGTGKTFTIEHMVVELMIRKENPLRVEQILIVTFTDKAAGELKARVRELIGKIVHASERQLGVDETEPHWLIGERERQLLEQALFSFEMAQISTIHSFCQRVLKEIAFFARGLMGRELVSGSSVFDTAFADCLREKFTVDDTFVPFLKIWLETGSVESLRSLLWGAVRFVVEKPGTRRASKLPCKLNEAGIKQGMLDIQKFILGSSSVFKGRSLQKFRNRLTFLLVDKSRFAKSGQSAETLFSALEAYESPKNRVDLLRLLFEKQPGLKEALAELPELLETVPTELAAEAERLVGFVLSEVPSFNEALMSEFLPSLYERISGLKADEGWMDFEDLLEEIDVALERYGEAVVPFLRDRHSVALIDEFQDTDPVQWAIFRKVFFESPQHRAYLVGDPKQSIYRFRGADVNTYLLARNEVSLANPGSLVRLEHNFRSSDSLIQAYNAILSASGSFFQGAIRYDSPVKCGDIFAKLTAADGTEVLPVCCVRILPPDDKTKIWASTNEYRTAWNGFLVQEIGKILGVGNSADVPVVVVKNGARTLVAGDIFVLTRSNGEARQAARVLQLAGIPCTLFQTGSVFVTVEAEEVDVLLDAILDPTNAAKIARVAAGPFFLFPFKSLGDLVSHGDGEPFVSIQRWSEMATRGELVRLFTVIPAESGLLRRELFSGVSERALTNFMHIFEIIGRWSVEEGLLLDELSLRLKRALAAEDDEGNSENMQRLETDASSVQILTMHKSKGLEAPVVFFYGGLTEIPQRGVATVMAERNGERSMWCADASLRRFDAELRAATSEENERLLYVALTRAGRRIYLPYFARALKQSRDGSSECWELPALAGIYEKIAMRLNQLLDSSDVLLSKDSEQFRKLAEVRVVPSAQVNVGVSRSAARVVPIAEWKPPQNVELLLHEKEFAEIRNSQRAPGTSSYTKLKKMSEKVGRTGSDEIVQPWLELPVISAADLPRGATFGVAVHECFQYLQWSKYGNFSVAEFLASSEVISIIESSLRRAGIALTHVSAVGEMIFATIKSPMILPGVAKSFSCCDIRDPGCEIAFCMPWPESEHFSAESDFWPVKRGWLVGACDVIFECHGRYFVLDWKTDTLPDYSVLSCEKRFLEHYSLQAKIYAVAVCRLLGIGCAEDYDARFGGHVYMFVRGPCAISGKMSWEEISSFERSLALGSGMTLSGGEA